MDAIVALFGLVLWFFAIVGFLMGGKLVLRWYTGMVASDPEGFRRRMGIPTAPESAPPMRP